MIILKPLYEYYRKWSVVEMKLFESGKQCNTKRDSWETIKNSIWEIEPVKVKKNKKKTKKKQ